MATIKQKSKEKSSLVINTLVVKKLNRSILDVGKWRDALRAADNGRRERLYDLYEDILLDPVLSGAITKRINSITNADIKFVRNNDPVPEMDQLIDSPAFEDLISEIIQSRFWGKSVVELDFSSYFDVYSIPRTHINPGKGLITINASDDNGIPYRGDDFFIEAGNDKDFGLLLKASPYAIFKRGGFSDWAQFCELFGIPKTIGKYNAQDNETKKALEESFTEYGSAAWMLVPKETDIEMKESSTRGEGKLFDNFRRACNEEILITILGQTMTTVDGSSRAQSETHKEVEEDINAADRRFVRRILNRELLPRLEKRGFPVSGGMFIFPDTGETISLTKQIDIDSKLVNGLGLEIDEDFLYEHYNRPKATGKGKAAKGKRRENQEPAASKEKEKEKLRDDDTPGLFQKLLSFFALAPASIGASAEGQLSGDLLTEINLADLPDFDVEDLAKRIQGGTTYFDPGLFYYTTDLLIKAIHAGFLNQNFADIGIEYGYTPDAFKTAMEINLFHFSAAKDLAEIQELNKAFRDSTGWNDFLNRTKIISKKFNEVWLRTEYNAALQIAESSALYQRLVGKSDLFTHWQYVTMDDDKVRPEHALLHGIILPANHPHWKKIFPPNGWRCRCTVKPLMKHELPAEYKTKNEEEKVDSALETSEWKKAEAQGWAVNRALTAEVFTANQMYIRKFPTKAAAYLNKLTFEKWGLNTVIKLMKTAKTKTPLFDSNADSIWLMENVDGYLNLKLYDGRTLKMSKNKFYEHASNKKEERIKLWKALKEVLGNPDEVWLNDYSSDAFDNFNLIKYYNDKVITAIYKIEDGELILKTWHDIYPKKAVWLKKRRGLLIKKQDNL